MAGAKQQHADLAAAALATGQTVAGAAAAAGTTERNVYRWLQAPAFKARVAELRADAVARATGRLADGMSAAADVLRGLLAAERESVRLGAARSLIELGVKLRDSTEFEARLQALENATHPRTPP